MPTVGLPGMRSIRMDSACNPRHKVFGQRGDAAVLDAGFGLELEGGHHRAGVDLHHEPSTLNSSNFDLMRTAMSFSSAGEQHVPITFNDDRSESAIKIPTTPPAENAPFHGRQKGRMESAVEMLRKSTAAPNTFTVAAWIGAERIHFQASSHRRTGRLKALRPSN
jgi:hypothetical protein